MSSRVEQKVLERTGQQILYPPTEKIGVIVVDSFPSLGKLAALRFIEWVQQNPEGVIALPTDTVYGLGAHGLVSRAVEQLYVLKERERQKAIPLLIGDIAALTSVAADVPESAWRLAERFWPGPLTLVLPKAHGLPDVLTAGGPSVAVRVPAHVRLFRIRTKAYDTNRSLHHSALSGRFKTFS